MMYRSPYTRWLLALAGFTVGAVLTFGEKAKWRSTPSFRWLEQIPIPLQVWGAAFMVYAVMLLFLRTRPVGFLAGAFLYGVFGLSLIATLASDGPKNIVVIGGLVDVVVFHIFSIGTAWAQRYAA